MRVKVGNRWYSAEPGQPIAVELTEENKALIATMQPENKRLGEVADGDGLAICPAAIKGWLADG